MKFEIILYDLSPNQTGGNFVFYKPKVSKISPFLAASPENVRKVVFYENIGSRDAVERYPYHFRYLAKEHGTDGFELELQVQNYTEENPYRLEGTRPITITKVRAQLYVHHIDENWSNNADANLRTLCHWCHQEAHQAVFAPFRV